MSTRKKILVAVFSLFLLAAGGAVLFAKPLGDRLMREVTPRLQAWATQSLGSEVKFSAIEMQWKGLSPRVVFKDVALGSSGALGNPAAGAHAEANSRGPSAQELSFVIDLWLSAMTREPKLTRLGLTGLNIALEQDAKKNWRIRGLTLPAAQPATSNTAESAPGAHEIPPFLALPFGIDLLQADLTVAPAEVKPIRVQLHELRTDTGLTVSPLSLRVAARAITLQAPDLYSDSRLIDNITAELAYNSTAQPPAVVISSLTLANSAAALEAHGKLALSAQNAIQTLELETHLAKAASIQELRAQLPKGLLPAAVQRWIASSITQGKLSALELSLKGDPRTAAFGRSLKLRSQFEGLELIYDEAWPHVQGASGSLTLEGEALSFTLSKASSLGVSIQSAKGSLAHDKLTLDLATDAAQSGLERWVWEGPFAKATADAKKRLELRSGAQLGVHIEIPLTEDDEDAETQVTAQIKGLAARVLPSQDDITELSAEVNVTHAGESGKVTVGWKDLKALAFGQTLTAQGTYRAGGARSQLESAFTATVPWERLRKELPAEQAQQLTFLAGQTSLEGKLSLEMSDQKPAQTMLKFNTGLEGIEISLPAPLQKEAQAAWSGNGEIAFTGATLTRARWHSPLLEVDYRAATDEAAASIKALVSGGSLEWKTWNQWWKDFSKTPQAPQGDAATEAALDLELHLKLKELAIPSNTWHDVDLKLTRESQQLTARITSREAIGDASLSLPAEKGTLKLHLDPLKLERWPSLADASGGASDNAATQKTEAEDDSVPRTPWNWKAIPELKIFIENASLGPDHLGTIKLSTKKTEDRISLDEAQLRGKQWDFTLTQGTQRLGVAALSEWKGKLDLHDLDRPFKDWRALDRLRIPEGALSFDFKWPGTWDQFGWAKLQGQVQGRFRRGNLVGVKAGATSLINLLDIKFSDKDERRLQFAAFDFLFRFNRGNLETPKSKLYFGSTFVKVVGKTNLTSERLEFDVMATPTLSGKSLARALSIITEDEENEILERELYTTEPENLLTQNYRIRGTWDSPRQE